MSHVEAFLWVAVGILVSVFIPACVKVLKKPILPEGIQTPWFVKVIKHYAGYGLASLAVALLILALALAGGLKMEFWYQAFLAGYVWDSTIQKLKEGARDPNQII